MVLTRLLSGASTLGEAAAVLGLSERQTWRLKARFAAEGPAAVMPGNRRGPCPARIPEKVRRRVLAVATRYHGGQRQSPGRTARRAARHIGQSRVSVRCIRRVAGFPSARGRRAPRHRSRRDRRP